MAVTITQFQGLNDTTYAALKNALKTELAFPVTVRRHTQRYAYHHVDIRPTAATQHRWTETQVEALRDFCARHGLDDRMGVVRHRADWHFCTLQTGMNYLARWTTISA